MVVSTANHYLAISIMSNFQQGLVSAVGNGVLQVKLTSFMRCYTTVAHFFQRHRPQFIQYNYKPTGEYTGYPL